ncbi:hypothetical protein AB670_00267 [Chryseobacterium sp. MOF25P]|uniref:hypothetical protein n=1 Tax=unclassified Chryseobacterium TaxID=2593645 RepID=UPI000804F2B8|nr:MULTISPECIES: hypothetical protein [unclassified Chryseobacterium]OBW43350.1 hypothetical protein AB670_00267 [Chryseobacterium sp. MOF25P]OBW46992.1 hypothetical protein AB671_00868 [Chryseobacterium sp. BGARF1]
MEKAVRLRQKWVKNAKTNNWKVLFYLCYDYTIPTKSSSDLPHLLVEFKLTSFIHL